MPSQANESEEEETSYHADYLPDVDYNGYEFGIVGYDEYPSDIEEPTGNVINDAIYERNRMIEEKYNIRISQTSYPYAQNGTVAELMKKGGLSSTDDFDLYNVVFANAYAGVIGGYVPTASSFPVIDLSKPWYYTALNERLNINGIQLLAYTAFDKNPGGRCIVFNTKIVSDLNLESPYKLVDDGAWTYDKVYEMALAAVSDVDGSGSFDEADQYGFISSTDDMTDFAYYGSGILLVDFSEGMPKISENEKLYDMFSKITEYKVQSGFLFDVFKVYGMKTESQAKGLALFKSGHSLFTLVASSSLTTMGDMEDDYGITPYPKLSEAQSQYLNPPDGSRITVPLGCSKDLERVCVIKEALSVESMNINYPAYYEVSLKNRYVRDSESVRMLEIITRSVIYDVGAAMDYSSIRGPWMDTFSKGSTDYISAVERNAKAAARVMDKMAENIEALSKGN